jgi:hypothetical protein
MKKTLKVILTILIPIWIIPFMFIGFIIEISKMMYSWVGEIFFNEIDPNGGLL